MQATSVYIAIELRTCLIDIILPPGDRIALFYPTILALILSISWLNNTVFLLLMPEVTLDK